VSDQVVELAALAYEAGAEPARWPVFLERMNLALGDRTCAFQVHDVQQHSGSLAVAVGQDPAATEAYDTYYAALNPWTAAGARLMQPGRVLFGEMVMSVRELKRTEFYADFLRPLQIEHTISAMLARDADTVAFVSVQRSGRLGEYTAEERGLLEHLVPHLQRAYEVHRRLGALRRRDQALADTAEHLPWAVLFVDRSRRIVFANALARSIDRPTMSRILVRANAGGGVVQRDARRPLTVTVAPLLAEDPLLLDAHPMQLVFVVDPEARRASPHAWLRAAYGLTSAEARLAVALAGGATLADISDQTASAIGTLRTHLKRVLAKTGTRRQSELVRLVLLGAPLVQ
jgi:DNA-binding CsgD family transcriptional regulator